MQLPKVRFYKKLLEKTWKNLPDAVSEEARVFLLELQNNYCNESSLAKCEPDPRGRLAYALPDGYWLFFKITVPNQPYTTLSHPTYIDVLDVTDVDLFESRGAPTRSEK